MDGPPTNEGIVKAMLIAPRIFRQRGEFAFAEEKYGSAITIAKGMPDLGENWTGLIAIYQELADLLADNLERPADAEAYRAEARRIQSIVDSN